MQRRSRKDTGLRVGAGEDRNARSVQAADVVAAGLARRRQQREERLEPGRLGVRGTRREAREHLGRNGLALEGGRLALALEMSA